MSCRGLRVPRVGEGTDRMPLYEYYCQPCDGVFELLRPAREASKPQPCPECDDDAERIISKQWQAFIFRDGVPRKLPDDGTYWHLGKKVSKPITGPTDGVSHPELKKPKPDPAPTVEDIERYEVLKQVQMERELSQGFVVHDQTFEQREKAMRKQLRRKAETQRAEREKSRILRKLSVEEQKTRYAVTQETEAKRRASLKRRKADGEYVGPSGR